MRVWTLWGFLHGHDVVGRIRWTILQYVTAVYQNNLTYSIPESSRVSTGVLFFLLADRAPSAPVSFVFVFPAFTFFLHSFPSSDSHFPPFTSSVFSELHGKQRHLSLSCVYVLLYIHNLPFQFFNVKILLETTHTAERLMFVYVCCKNQFWYNADATSDEAGASLSQWGTTLICL